MRVAVLSDVHADARALERVLTAVADAAPDELWCLGDILGLGGSEPAEALQLVLERCALVLKGNHDAWVTGELPLEMLPLPRQRAELEWQRAALSDEQLAWLVSLPAHAERAGVELWHGSAQDPLGGWVKGEPEAAAHLARQHAPVGLAGHTHRPAVAHCRRGELRWSEPPPRRVSLAEEGRWLLNPGSVVGGPRWLELDLAEMTATWHG